MTTLLAGDIGGTKTLLSLHAVGDTAPELLTSARYASADWGDLAAMVSHFLAGTEGHDHPSVACLAVAGPVMEGRARLTNLPWELSETDLAV